MTNKSKLENLTNKEMIAALLIGNMLLGMIVYSGIKVGIDSIPQPKYVTHFVERSKAEGKEYITRRLSDFVKYNQEAR